MKLIKKRFFLISLIALCGITQSHNVLNDSLEDFLDRMEKNEQSKKGFRVYYSNFLEQQNKLYKNGKHKKLARLRSKALITLKEEKPEWYKFVEPYSLDLEESTQEARQVRLLLTRYALFNAYKNGTAVKLAGSREKVKNILRPIKHAFVFVKDKVSGLFGKS